MQLNTDSDFSLEEQRLAKLHSYRATPYYRQSGTFQHIARMAAHIFNVPIALVNFVDNTEVLTVANHGLSDLSSSAREISLCSMAIEQDSVLVFESARDEPCLLSNPAVHGNLGVQFYAGAPLFTPDGFKIGVLMIVDRLPRKFSADDRVILESLAALVVEELEAHQSLVVQLDEANNQFWN